MFICDCGSGFTCSTGVNELSIINYFDFVVVAQLRKYIRKHREKNVVNRKQSYIDTTNVNWKVDC